MTKPYATLRLSEDDFKLIKSAVAFQRAAVFKNWEAAGPGPEREYYSALVDRHDAVRAQFDKILVADTSQDPEPEDEEP